MRKHGASFTAFCYLLEGMLVLTDREEAAYVPPTDGDELTDGEALGILVGGAV